MIGETNVVFMTSCRHWCLFGEVRAQLHREILQPVEWKGSKSTDKYNDAPQSACTCNTTHFLQTLIMKLNTKIIEYAIILPFAEFALRPRALPGKVVDNLLCVLHQRQDGLAVEPTLAQTLVLACK